MTTLLAVVAAVGAVYALAATALWLGQHALVFQPGVPGREVPRNPEAIGLAYEPIRLRSPDGPTLTGWFIPAPDADAPVALFLHGNAGNIGHRLGTLEMLHEAGLATLIIDYRGYGESEGRPSERGTEIDARTAWHWLTAERGIPSSRIVIFGRSLGGAVAARLAARVRPAGLILESAFTSLPDLAADLYPWLPARGLVRYDFNTADALGRTDCPLLIVHSPTDEIIPFAHAQRLAAIHPGRTERFDLTGGHNEGFLVSQPAYTEALSAFAHRVAAERTPDAAAGIVGDG